MIKPIKRLDAFSRNIIVVFLGTSFANLLNLLYQLLIAHKLNAAEFAAFNSLLSLFMVISSPLNTIQMAVAKYSAEFNAGNQLSKIKFILTDLFKKSFILTLFTLLLFSLASNHIVSALKIPSLSSGYILAGLIALSWLSPLVAGGVQGLEFFGWVTLGSVASAALKLALAFVFILLGYSVAGALGALLIAGLFGIAIYYLPLRKFICLKAAREDIGYRRILTYLFPVALSNLCFIALVSFDMVLVRYFFPEQASGAYSLAQMVGKIFLFLPGAISIVMFPKVSGLNARHLDTVSTLKKSLVYVLGPCLLAAIFYNLFPSFVLKILTGKAYPESISLGRLFSFSMSLFSIVYIFISYFLSLNDLRFVKYLVLFTVLQFLAIALFHSRLIQVQAIMCINALLLFCVHYLLAGFNKRGL